MQSESDDLFELATTYLDYDQAPRLSLLTRCSNHLALEGGCGVTDFGGLWCSHGVS